MFVASICELDRRKGRGQTPCPHAAGRPRLSRSLRVGIGHFAQYLPPPPLTDDDDDFHKISTSISRRRRTHIAFSLLSAQRARRSSAALAVLTSLWDQLSSFSGNYKYQNHTALLLMRHISLFEGFGLVKKVKNNT